MKHLENAVFNITNKVAQQRWELAQFNMSEFPTVSFLIVTFFPLVTVAGEWEAD